MAGLKFISGGIVLGVVGVLLGSLGTLGSASEVSGTDGTDGTDGTASIKAIDIPLILRPDFEEVVTREDVDKRSNCRCDLLAKYRAIAKAQQEELAQVEKYFGPVEERRVAYTIYDYYGWFYLASESKRRSVCKYIQLYHTGVKLGFGTEFEGYIRHIMC